jgi:drug/metabolite transporter (DMT)-like permease
VNIPVSPLRAFVTSPYVLLTLCFLFWSGNSVFARGAADVMPPMNLAFLRWGVGIIVLFPFAARALWRERAIYRRHWKIFFLVALSGVTGFNSLIYHAVQHTTAIHASLITAAVPAASVIASWLAYRETISWRTALAMMVAFVGVVVVISNGEVAVFTSLAFNTGDLIAVLAVISWTIYSVGLRAMPRETNPLGLLLGVMIVGWIFLTPIYVYDLATGTRAALTIGNVAGVLYLGVFASVVAFAFFNFGVARLGANRANVFNYLAPIFSGVLAVAFLGETLEWFHGLSIALIFGGIYLAQRARGSEPQAAKVS